MHIHTLSKKPAAMSKFYVFSIHFSGLLGESVLWLFFSVGPIFIFFNMLSFETTKYIKHLPFPIGKEYFIYQTIDLMTARVMSILSTL